MFQHMRYPNPALLISIKHSNVNCVRLIRNGSFQMSGTAIDLEEELCAELDIVGRINPDTVWEYIGKTKKGTNKDIDLLRLQAANDEEKMQYIALYSYLSSRNRCVLISDVAEIKSCTQAPLIPSFPVFCLFFVINKPVIN